MNWKKLVKRLKNECTVYRGSQRTKHKTKHFENEFIITGIEEIAIDFESYLYPVFCYPSVGSSPPQMGSSCFFSYSQYGKTEPLNNIYIDNIRENR